MKMFIIILLIKRKNYQSKCSKIGDWLKVNYENLHYGCNGIIKMMVIKSFLCHWDVSMI